MRLIKRTLLFTVMALQFTAYAAEEQKTNPLSPNALHLEWLDKTVSPEQNFYEYANGVWLKNNPIPPAYANWSPFKILQLQIQDNIHHMLMTAASKHNPPGSIEQKIGDFYFSGMDKKNIEARGVEPLKPDFNQIEAIQNQADLQSVIAHLQLEGVDVLFSFGSMQDFMNSQQVIGVLMQGGLGLPDRDYYLKQDKKFAQIRQLYQEHMARMFQLLGDSPSQSQQEASTVLTLETRLAKASMSQVKQRDPRAIYHLISQEKLTHMTPHFSWSPYFSTMDQPTIKQINLAMPHFFVTMDALLTTVSINDWKTYLRWHLIDTFAPYLSKNFVEEDFKMSSALTGAKKLLPRWQRVVSTENAALGFALGELYIKKYFSPEAKAQALDILKNIRASLQSNLKTLPWMTPKTRQAALQKLQLMQERVGYPSKWWDYSSLTIDRKSYVHNILRANTFLIKRDLNKIGKPVDETEWAMTPQTVNAYYDPSMNNLNIPAGILQSPFFDINAPAAVNYGSMGFVMGHEMIHGFDDQGAQFDGHGNLKNWWQPLDLKKFQAATNCIVEQFSKYKMDNVPVRGKLVVGEATADLGGLLLAYKAFLASKDYKNAKPVAGFSPEQQFFLGAAHVWATNIRPELTLNLLVTDPHPPAIYRVNGTFANLPQFQNAFSIPNQSPMTNQPRCVIW